MKYLYFILYHSFKKVPTNDTPAINALILLVVIQCVNILTLLVLIFHFLEIGFSINTRKEAYLISLPLFLITFAINFFLLYRNREEISERFKDKNKKQVTIGIIMVAVYAIGSFLIIYFASTKFPILMY
jgi:hypothetical protein